MSPSSVREGDVVATSLSLLSLKVVCDEMIWLEMTGDVGPVGSISDEVRSVVIVHVSYSGRELL